MQGKIIKGIAGFYYVDVAESGIYECKAKGIFRKEKKKPLVGDNVEIEVLDEKEKTGNLIQILPRKNELIRPAAANVDQALVIFAVRQPDPNYQLLDRFLITMEQQEIPSIICFNKKDLAEQEELDQMYLAADSRRIEFETEVDWKEMHRLLKAGFPVNVYAENGINEMQFGFVEHPTHRSRAYDKDRFEVCNHRYSALADGAHGAAVLNDCKYGISMNGNALELTLLRAGTCPEMCADNRVHQ